MTDGRRSNGRYKRGLPLADRFWQKVQGGDFRECWIWQAAIKQGSGYGQFQEPGGVKRLAHRWAYEFLFGAIPDGLHLDHLCRVRTCVNPWHLDPVTPLVNVRRGIGHGSETHCPQGHPYDETNTYRHDGRRACKKCRRIHKINFKARRAA